MSAVLDRALDSARLADCIRNDEAIRCGLPVIPARFECVEAPKPVVETSMETSE